MQELRVSLKPAPCPRSAAPRDRAALWFFTLLAAYVAGHFVVRLLLARTLERDEAEQMILSQAFAWGYSEQPPLYTWIVRLGFAVFGPSMHVLLVLRWLLLGGSYALLYLVARWLTRDPRRAALAACSPVLAPTLGYEALRDFTHSLLMNLVVLVTLVVWIRLLETGRRRWYFGFGLSLGCGLLAKYNYLLFAAAFVGAAAVLPVYRSRVLCGRMAVALCTAFLIVLPHLAWLAEHAPLVHGKLRDRAGLQHVQSHFSAVGLGLYNLGINLLLAWGFLAAAYGWCFGRPRFSPLADARTERIAWFLGVSLAGCVLLLLALVVLFGLNQFNVRWLQPLVFLAPLYLFTRSEVGTAAGGGAQRYAVVLLAAVLAAGVVRIGQFWWGREAGSSLRARDASFEELAGQLRPTVAEDALVISEDDLIGGNVKKLLPRCRVLCLAYPACAEAGRLPARPSSVVVVWHAVDDRPCPPQLAAFARQVVGAQTFEASTSPPRFAGIGRHRMGWIQSISQDVR